MSDRTILLVEDNDDDIELTRHAFSKSKLAHSMVIAHDGEEALDYLLGHGDGPDQEPMPALILLDIKLPGINGLEVLRRLRDAPRTKRIPVVILTTSDDESDIIRGYDLGVNSYIRKPVNYGDFTKVADQLGLYWLAVNTPAPQ